MKVKECFGRLYVVIILLMLPGSFPVVAQEQWFSLNSPDADFSVQFPSKPTYELVPVPTTGEQLHTYHFNFGNQNLYFNYMELRPRVTSRGQVTALLADYSRKYTQYITNSGGQVLRQMPLPDGGIEIVSRFPAGKIRETVYERSRIYFSNTRRYVISCTSLTDSGVDQTLAQRFFSSLRLSTSTKRQSSIDNSLKDSGREPAPSTSVAEVSWYGFKGPDGDYEAEFPAKPLYSTRAHPVTGGEVQNVSFTYGEHDLSIYSAELVPPLATPADRTQWFARSVETFLRGTESKLIQETWLIDGALQIESQGVLGGRVWFIRARFYVRGTKAYVVSCSVYSHSRTALNDPVPSHFFDSFRLK